MDGFTKGQVTEESITGLTYLSTLSLNGKKSIYFNIASGNVHNMIIIIMAIIITRPYKQ